MNAPLPFRPPLQPLYDREPWDGGPQSQQRSNAPLPNQRAQLRPSIGGAGFSGNAQSPLTFPVPAWGAEAHRYAFVLNMVVGYASGASAKVLDAPVTYRNLLMIRNLDAADSVAVSFGADASANSVIQLPPSGFLLWDVVVPQDDMYVFGLTGAGNLAIAVSTIALPPVPAST